MTTSHRSPRRRWLLLAMPWLTLAAGCGTGDRPRIGTVTGTVTLDGKPLGGAFVAFRPKAGGQVSKGTTDESGRYRLTFLRDLMGAAVGSHTVSIRTVAETMANERLPERYHAASSLEADVKSGSNRFDFQLTSEP